MAVKQIGINLLEYIKPLLTTKRKLKALEGEKGFEGVL